MPGISYFYSHALLQYQTIGIMHMDLVELFSYPRLFAKQKILGAFHTPIPGNRNPDLSFWVDSDSEIPGFAIVNISYRTNIIVFYNIFCFRDHSFALLLYL
jgi:hypothetical protein